jgi:anti-anti-sigma factor
LFEIWQAGRIPGIEIQEGTVQMLRREGNSNMKIHEDLGVLHIEGIRKLDATNALALRDLARAAVTGSATMIEIDLSQTDFLDSCGLGALIAIRNMIDRRGGVLRLLNPTRPARRILELTRLHRVLEIVYCDPMLAG